MHVRVNQRTGRDQARAKESPVAEQLRIDAGFGTIFATAHGPRDGEPVIALHSLGMSSDLWAPVAMRLGDAGIRVIAVDARGHGRTTKARIQHARDWVQDLLVVVEELFGPSSEAGVHLLGASMGSIQALEFATSHPRRVHTLMLASGFGRMPRDLAASKTAKLTQGPASVGMTAWGAKYAEETLVTKDDATRELVRSTVSRTTLMAYTDAVRACYEERTGDITSISIPSLVLWGEADTKTPASLSEELTADLPDARMVRIPRAGHLCMLDQPEAFANEILAFLRERGF